MRKEWRTRMKGAFKIKPIAKMMALRRRTCRMSDEGEAPRLSLEAKENTSETPTMKTKKGKIKSVGVQPFHSACFKGQ